MAKGRKQLPEHLKVVKGTNRPDRKNAAAPIAPDDLPRAPEWLPPRAIELFGQMAAVVDRMKIASSAHSDMLAMAAFRKYEIERYTEILEDEGEVYTCTTKDGGTMYRARPEVGLRNEALRHFQSLLAEFGLSPATIGKVSVKGGKERLNPFKGLSNG